MKTIFADACYWIAILHEKDPLHAEAMRVSSSLVNCRIVTTEMVLVELMNSLGKYGGNLRVAVAQTIASLEANLNVEVIPQTSLQFRSATKFYAARLDKDWGATDCASFLLMEEKSISEALTADHHFRQAGFTALMEKNN